MYLQGSDKVHNRYRLIDRFTRGGCLRHEVTTCVDAVLRSAGPDDAMD